MATLPPNVTNLLLRTFGRLTVRKFVETHKGEAYWRCSCECGTTDYVVRGKNLIRWEKEERAISCGCYKADPIVRANARNELTPEERSKAAGGEKVRETPPDKPAPVKRAKKPKRDPLPVRKDYTPSAAAIAARGTAPRPVPPPVTPAAEPQARQPEPDIVMAQPARKPLWVAVAKDREGGYRLHIRLERANTHSEIQGRRESTPHHVRRSAERLFGTLDWQTGEQAGLQGQPWVLEIAPFYVSRSE